MTLTTTPPVEQVEDSLGLKTVLTSAKRNVIGIFLALLGALTIWAFSLNVSASARAILVINPRNGVSLNVTAPHVPVRAVDLGLGLLVVVLGLLIVGWKKSRHPYRIMALGLAAFGVAVVIWAARGGSVSFVGLIVETVVASTPLVFGSMSGVLCERSGVINIAIEGQFLAGAFLGAMIGSATHDLWLGLIAGALGGGLMGALLAVLTLRYKADQVIVGVVIVTFATGLTNFLTLQVLTPHQSSLNTPSTFNNWAIPLLSKIPIIGPTFFDQDIFVYMAIVLVIVIHLALTRTRWGLRVRAVGEHPEAAETVGISVFGVRYRNVILGGLVGGIGGAAFTIGGVGQFTSEMTSGLGYVALAAMVFGGWRPIAAAGAGVLFGFSESLEATLSNLNTPINPNLLAMLPYVVTIIAVSGLVGRVRAPAADGKPYSRE